MIFKASLLKKKVEKLSKEERKLTGLEPTLDAALIQMRTISNLKELIDIAFCTCLFMQTPGIASRIDSSDGVSDCNSFVRAEAYTETNFYTVDWTL